MNKIPYVFIINLKARSDRREHMIQLMKDLNLNQYEFVEPLKVKEGIGRMNKNELSLILTVKNILDTARARSLDKCMIFEDDVIINDNKPANYVRDKITEAITSLPSDPSLWDLLYLEYCYESCKDIIPYNNVLYKVSAPWCTASIIYNCNTNSINKIFRCLDKYMLTLDASYSACFKADELYGFMIYPPLFYQDDGFNTNIEASNVLMSIKHMVEGGNRKNICKGNYKQTAYTNITFICIVSILIYVLSVLFVVYYI